VAASLAGPLAAALALAFAAPAPPAPDRFPGAAAAYLVELDGRPLWARAPDAPLLPASLAKLMTALLVVEDGWDPAAPVAVSARAAGATGSRLGLRAGERLRAGDALAATLVASANDACLALAEHAAGSEAAFVARMNARAAALGLARTRFANACGHDAPGQRASARDLLRLARAAVAIPEVRRLVALERATVTLAGGRRVALRTTNVLLGRLPGARGVKSGFTAGAGRCIVALAERDGREVLLVLLDARDRWWTASGIVEAAFAEARRRG
jgi:D-alanyl-D-alanine carboxypeptidase (penicillin-binding protein 5/6)